MSDECPIPGTTPMAGSATTGPTTPSPEARNFLVRLLRADCFEDPKKLVTLAAASGLIQAFVRIGNAAVAQVKAGNDISGGTQATLLGLALFIAGLAGYIHRTPNNDPLHGGQ